MDDSVLDSLAAMDLALVALDMRADSDDDVVPTLFSTTELPYRGGFSVTVGTARDRIRRAEQQSVLNAFPVYVAAFDSLLDDTIEMLRLVGVDRSERGRVQTDSASKIARLRSNARLDMSNADEALWALLVSIRHSVVHDRSAPTRVVKAWKQCQTKRSAEGRPAQEIWEEAAGQPLPIRAGQSRLELTACEIIACQRILDNLAISLSDNLRERVSPGLWAKLAIRELEGVRRSTLNDPSRGARKLGVWCANEWGIEVDVEACQEALADRIS